MVVCEYFIFNSVVLLGDSTALDHGAHNVFMRTFIYLFPIAVTTSKSKCHLFNYKCTM